VREKRAERRDPLREGEAATRRWAGLGVAATAFVLVITGALHGQQQSLTGNFWKELPDDARLTYASGFIDGMLAATTAPGFLSGHRQVRRRHDALWPGQKPS
jgi:hypothetical protein